MAGTPQVVLRGDGAIIHTGESSFEKAFTVVTLGPIFDFDTSGKFFDLVKTNPYAPRLATVRNVMALRTSDGATLWHSAVGNVGNSPITYEFDGRQYVIVASGGVLFAWALPERPAEQTRFGSRR